MWTDAVDLRDFYASNLGTVARRMICRAIRTHWPNLDGMDVLGLGFPTPYLNAWQGQPRRTIAAMPAMQGVLHWPADGPGQTTLVNEYELPFPDRSMDRVLMVHALECSDNVRPMMREIWRVLSDSGRLIVVTPNRRGLWARLERTPFGRGRPYSRSQLSTVLRENMFTPTGFSRALFMPPTTSRMMLATAPALEEVGRRWFGTFSGVVIAEACKQIYGGQPVGNPKRAYIPVPQETR